MKPRMLDLFCGAGGCSVGYARAGFDVVGVDIEPHPDYPFEFHQADALEWLQHGGWHDFDAIHASPPCQAMTTMSNRYRGQGGRADGHVNLIPHVRELLVRTGKPYVIENVPGAAPHMRSYVILHGGMFGLRVYRPRLFESNVFLMYSPASGPVNPLGIYGKSPDGRRLFDRGDGTIQRAARSIEEGAAAMGIDWMTDWADITEAIPPAYTEYIGEQILTHLAPSNPLARILGEGQATPGVFTHTLRGTPPTP